MVNLRLNYQKRGLIRFTSHLDTMRIFTRAFYRSGLPVYFTEGFNPHPYIVLGLPLSLGFESLCDICDFRLMEPVSEAGILSRLQPVLPEGITLLSVTTEPEPLKQIALARYRTVFEGAFAAEKADAVRELFTAEQLLTTKKSKKGGEKEVDIRPLIHELSVSATDGRMTLDSLVAAGSGDNLNPDLFLKLIREQLALPIDGYLHTRVEILKADRTPLH